MSKASTPERKQRRDTLLRQMKHHQLARSSPEEISPGWLGWDEIGIIAEGLAFANRPLKRATQEATERYDLGPRGAWILNLLSNGVAHPTDLSTMFNVGRSLITAELVRLTEAGLITAKPGQTDRRKSELMLTPEGDAACRQIRDRISAIVHGNLQGYSTDEIRKFARMLRDVRADDSEDETDAVGPDN